MVEFADHRSTETLAEPARLRRALRAAIESALPALRVVAEGFLTESSPTDLLAVGGDGEIVSIRIAEPGGDAAVLTRVLADLSWLRPRREDFLKLAPGLGIEPSAEPRALVLARDFGRETLAAVDNFPAMTVSLWRWQGIEATARPRLWIESASPEQTATARMAGTRSAPAAPLPGLPRRPSGIASPSNAARYPERGGPLADPPSPSAFRTGLVEADLEPAPPPETSRPIDLQSGLMPGPARSARRSR